MQKFWKSLLVSPAVLGAILLVDGTAFAGETIKTSENTQPQLVVTPNQSAGQVTSVSQLSDVQPTDWAFQALQSLVERYGCIAGYPNGTYRGNR